MQSTVGRPCAACGELFSKKPGPGRWPKFCSDKCRAPLKWAKANGVFVPKRPPALTGRCELCGSPCRSGNWHGKTRYCSSKECQRVANRIRSKEAYTPRPQVKRNCEVCGELFEGQSNKRLCSQKCRIANYNRLRREDGRAAEMSAKRRALEKGAKIKGGKRLAVLRSDGWVCYLCKKPTDRNVKYPHPDYPVIDHVVPLARGGAHEPCNWRTAHNSCNAKKSDMSVDEFRRKYRVS